MYYYDNANMIHEYYYTREQIVENIINDGKITNDGYYWYPNFININLKEGNEKDYEYYYPRELFKYKLYFSRYELKIYLSKIKLDYDIDDMYRKSIKFYENNISLININNINKKLPNVDFTLNELIDCFEYLNE